MRVRAWLAAVVLSVVASTASAHDGDRIGGVSFPTSCADAMPKPFERAVALGHSFSYLAAARPFTAVAQADPDCATRPELVEARAFR